MGNGEEDVTSVFTMRTRPDLVYCSYMKKILLFDTRNFTNPVEEFNFNEEEINQIILNEKEDFLASCDDSGNIKMINLLHKNVYKTLRKHTNICAAIAFRPKRPWDLLSGGYDQKLIHWDFARAKAVCNIDINEIGVTPDKFDTYIINPPFIHSIAVSPSGSHLACGTDNALVQVFDSSKRTLSYVTTLRGHSQGVSQVHFPGFVENILISGGNDGVCNIWKLDGIMNSDPQSNGVQRPHQNGVAHHNGVGHHSHAISNTPSSGIAGQGASSDTGWSSSNSDTSTNPDTNTSLSPRPCYGIQHSEKINWITSGATATRRFLILADSTNEATIYSYPDQ